VSCVQQQQQREEAELGLEVGWRQSGVDFVEFGGHPIELQFGQNVAVVRAQPLVLLLADQFGQ
jgi:hypothetical protein